jgi:hypothetical protein
MIFQKILERWHPKIDLFALPWNAQLPEFVCWHPDPAAWMTDAFSLNWKYIKGYAFPPFNLIGNCIRKMRQDQAQLTLVCPYWPSQPWFPLLLEAIVDIPRVLPYRKDLLIDVNGETHPLLTTNALCLIGGDYPESLQKRTISGPGYRSYTGRQPTSHTRWLRDRLEPMVRLVQ